MKLKKIKVVLSCSLLLSQFSLPLVQEVAFAETIEAPITSVATTNQKTLGDLLAQKERLKDLKYSKIGVPYKDLINVGFTAIETLISDVTAISKGEGVDPSTVYSLNSVGPRLIAIVEVIDAIDFSVNHLNNKVVDAHNLMGLKTTHLVYTLLNPLASNDRINKRIEELKDTKALAYTMPDLKGTDTATIYTKSAIDKAIWQTRFTRDEQILGKLPFDVYNALNKAITKAVFIQLDPTSTVDEINAAVKELNGHLETALKGEVTVVEARERNPKVIVSDLESKEEKLNKLKETLKGADYEDIIKRTIGLVENIKKEASKPDSVADGKVPVKVETIGSRLEAITTIIDGIVFATTEATNKVTDAHKQIGYAITKALIALSDPYASQGLIDKHVQKIINLKKDILLYPDLTIDSTATIYVKSKLDNAIWNTRFLRDQELLGKVPFETYDQLNRKITKAVGVQLNAKSTVADVETAIKNLKEALTTALGRDVTIVSEKLQLPEIVMDPAQRNYRDQLANDKILLEKVSSRLGNCRYDEVLTKAFELIDQFGKELDKAIEKDTLYPLGSLGSRMNALKTVIESIDYATTELASKDLAIHKDYGFNITRTLIALADPYTSNDKINQRIKELDELKEKATNAPDLNMASRANPSVRSSLSKTIWSVRFERDKTVLGKQPFEVYNNLNKEITKAVGVQLNPNSTVADVFASIEALEKALQIAQNGSIDPVVTTTLESTTTTSESTTTTVTEETTTSEVTTTTVAEETTTSKATTTTVAEETTTSEATTTTVAEETTTSEATTTTVAEGTTTSEATTTTEVEETTTSAAE